MHRAFLAAALCLMTTPLALADFDGEGSSAVTAPPQDPVPIGSLLPASAQLLPLPRYMEGYEALPGYRFARVADHDVLVDAQSRRILATLQ